MALAWSEVESKKEYQSLPDEQKAAAASQYFDEVVAPQTVDAAQLDEARNQFSTYTGFAIGSAPANSDAGALSDFGNELAIGGATTMRGLSSLVGADDTAEYFKGVATDHQKALSPEQTAADSNDMFVKTGEGSDWNPLNYSFGETPGRTLYGLGVQSVPGMAGGMGIGGAVTKGLGVVGNMVGTRAVTAAAAKGGDIAAKAAMKSRLGWEGAAGFGAGEGAVGAGTSKNAVYDKVMSIKPEVMGQSPEFQKLIKSGITPDDARSQIAEIASSQAAWTVGTVTALLGAPMGRWFSVTFGGAEVPASKLAAVFIGGGGEAAQELGQGGTEQVLQNKSVQQHADPSQSIGEGVINNALSGAAAGGVMGGAVGSFAPTQDNQSGASEFSNEETGGLYDDQSTPDSQEEANQKDIETQQMPESYQDLDAQALAVHEGRKPAVLVTDGAETPEGVDGLKAVPIENYGTLYTNQKVSKSKQSGETVVKIAGTPILNEDGSLNGQILGYASSFKPVDDSGMVTEGIDANGNIVHQEIGQGEEAAQAAMQVAGEGGQVRVIPTEQSITEREQRRQVDLQQLNEQSDDAQVVLQRQRRLQRFQQADDEARQADQTAQIEAAQQHITEYEQAMATGKFQPTAESQQTYTQAKSLIESLRPQVNLPKGDLGNIEQQSAGIINGQSMPEDKADAQAIAQFNLPSDHPYLGDAISEEDLAILADNGVQDAANALMIRKQLENSSEQNQSELTSNQFGAAEVTPVTPSFEMTAKGGLKITQANDLVMSTLRDHKIKFVMSKSTGAVMVAKRHAKQAMQLLNMDASNEIQPIAKKPDISPPPISKTTPQPNVAEKEIAKAGKTQAKAASATAPVPDKKVAQQEQSQTTKQADTISEEPLKLERNEKGSLIASGTGVRGVLNDAGITFANRVGGTALIGKSNEEKARKAIDALSPESLDKKMKASQRATEQTNKRLLTDPDKDSLVEFIGKHGGIRDDGPHDLTTTLQGISTPNGIYSLIRDKGMTLAKAWQKADEAGYEVGDQVEDLITALREGDIYTPAGHDNLAEIAMAEAEAKQIHDDEVFMEEMGGLEYVNDQVDILDDIETLHNEVMQHGSYAFIDDDAIPAEAITLDDLIKEDNAYESANNQTERRQGHESGRSSEAETNSRQDRKGTANADRRDLPGQEGQQKLLEGDKPKVSDEAIKLKPSQNKPIDKHDPNSLFGAKERADAKEAQPDMFAETKPKPRQKADAVEAKAADAAQEPSDIAQKQAIQEKKAPKQEEVANDFQDTGNIGGARKDLAVSKGKSPTLQKENKGWRSRYNISEIMGEMMRSGGYGSEMVDSPNNGKFAIFDHRKAKTRYGGDGMVGRTYYNTEEEAEAALPLVEVSRNHSVSHDRDGGFKIIRRVNDRKRVQVVAQKFDSEDDARRYMVENAEDIITTRVNFGEEILPKPENVVRKGDKRRDGNIKTSDEIKETFGFREVEFGKWNNQEERQEVVNHAYDALLDMAEALGIPPRAISLNGELALAFGSRGVGLSGAKAHYELNYGTINLTKMSGAGSLAHEWLHALDHYIGRLDGKAKSGMIKNAKGNDVFDTKGVSDFASHGFGYASKARKEIVDAYEKLIETMLTKAETYVEDVSFADEFLSRARESLESSIKQLRANLTEQLDPQYWKRKNKPATEEQITRFDELAKALINGEQVNLEFRGIESARGKKSYSNTNDVLEEMNTIYKEVRGRSGFRAKRAGKLDSIAAEVNAYAERIKTLNEANNGTEKQRKTRTDYLMRAIEGDQGRGGQYWATEHELAARAFAAYMEDKLAAKDANNDFLTYQAHGAVIAPVYPDGFFYPYPEGKERTEINKAFDNLFSTFKTKETEQGTALYSKGTATTGLSVAAAEQSIISRFGSKMKLLLRKGKVQVVRTATGLPESVKLSKGIESNVIHRELVAYSEGKKQRKELLRLGDTPNVLRLLGAKQLPVTMSQKVADKVLNWKHSLEDSVARQLQDAINDPVMIFASKTQQGSFVLMTEIKQDGKTIVVTIKADVENRGLQVNAISSIYGKDKDKFFKDQVDEGRLLYANKEKSRSWFREARLQLPWALNQSDSQAKYKTESDLLQAKYSKDGKIMGAFDPATGITYIVAENNDESTLEGVLLHESTHALDTSETGRKIKAKLIKHMLMLERAGNKESKSWIAEARKVIPADTKAVDVDEEVLAYAVQQHIESEASLPASIARMIKRYIAEVKAFLIAHTSLKIKISPAVITAIARQNLGRMAKADTVLTSALKESYQSMAKEYGITEEEAKQQYDDVVAKYKGTDQWLKAPNGKATKLNQRQWIQTHTPAFKAWFGEWELDSSIVEGAQSFIRNALSGKNMPNHKLWAIDNALARQINERTGLDVYGYKFELIADDIRHAQKSHGDHVKEKRNNPDQEAITDNDLLALPYIMKSPDNIRKGTGSSIIFEKKVNGIIESVEVVSNKYGKLRNKTMWKKKAAVGTNANQNDSPSHTSEYTSAQPSIYRSIEDFLEKSQPSKVVDENSEPMVVYHGSAVGGIINTTSNMTDIYTSNEKLVADSYAENAPSDDFPNREEARVTQSFFVSAKRTHTVDGKGASWTSVKGRDGGVGMYAVVREGMHADAVIIKNVQDDISDDGLEASDVVVINGSGDVKSATGNTGQFGETSDIRFSKSLPDSDKVAARVQKDSKEVATAIKRNMVNGSAIWFAKLLYFSPTQTVRDLNVPAARFISDMFYKDASFENREFEGLDMVQHEQERVGHFFKRFEKILEGLPKKYSSKLAQRMIIDALNGEKIAVSVLAESKPFKELLDELHAYMGEAGVSVSKLEHYFPRVYDIRYMRKNKERFIELVNKQGMDGEQVYMNIVENDGMYQNFADHHIELNEDKEVIKKSSKAYGKRTGSARKGSFEKGRVIDVPYSDLKHFLVRELEPVIGRHIRSVVKRAEYARVAGENNGKLEALAAKFVKQYDKLPRKAKYATMDEGITAINFLADRMQGKQEPLDPGVRRLSQALRNFSVMSHLGMVLLASIPETMMPYVKLGNGASFTKHLFMGFAEAMREGSASVLKVTTGNRVIPKSERRELAESLGVASQHGMEAAFQQRFGGVSSKMTNAFMRATMLEQLTNIQRMMSFGMAQDHIAKLSKKVGSAKGKSKMQFIMELRDFGLDPKKAAAWADKGFSKSDPFYDEVSMGAQRFAQQVITTPIGATLPRVMSHPAGQVMFQFKSFTSVHSNTFLKKLLIDMARYPRLRDKMRPILPIIAMVAVAYAVQLFREAWKYEDKKEAYLNDKAQWKRITSAIDRTGMTGDATSYINFAMPYRYGFGDVKRRLFNLGGPLLGDGARIIGATTADDKPKAMAKTIVNATPGLNVIPYARVKAKEVIEDLLD